VSPPESWRNTGGGGNGVPTPMGGYSSLPILTHAAGGTRESTCVQDWDPTCWGMAYASFMTTSGPVGAVLDLERVPARVNEGHHSGLDGFGRERGGACVEDPIAVDDDGMLHVRGGASELH
jgi:hypothetical protein